MAIAAISSISSAQPFQSTSTLNDSLQKALQSLQKSLTASDLTGAGNAFANVQQLSKTLAAKATLPDNQLATDIKALGTALDKGSVADAKAALTIVQNDTISSNARAIAASAAQANSTAQELGAILGSLNATGTSSAALFLGNSAAPSTIADQTTSYLSKVYGPNAVVLSTGTKTTGTQVNVIA